MAIIAALRHKTSYRYDRRVALGPQIIRLRPAPHTRAPIQSYALKVGPEPHFLNWQQDPFGNWLARCVFPEKVCALEIEVDLTLEHAIINPFDFFLEGYAETFPFAYESDLKKDLGPYLKTAKFSAEFAHYVETLPKQGPTVPMLVALNQRPHDTGADPVACAHACGASSSLTSLQSSNCVHPMPMLTVLWIPRGPLRFLARIFPSQTALPFS